MKKLIPAVAALLFVGSVSAATDAEIYHGFAKGNPDLSSGSSYSESRTAVQPGIGSGTGPSPVHGVSNNEIYHGFEKGNPDLWSGASRTASASVPGIGSRSGSASRHVSDNDIYHGFEKGNPDL